MTSRHFPDAMWKTGIIGAGGIDKGRRFTQPLHAKSPASMPGFFYF
jgi:hypothetical protein